MRDELYTINGVPFKGKKMLIPKPLRSIVLEGLHQAHQGVSSMLANARERFFWPGLDAAVRNYRLQCRQCNEQAPSQHNEPPTDRPQPEFPFQQVATDLFKLSGFQYLVYVDGYSGWIEVANLTTTNFRAIEKVFLMYFALFGVIEEISSDGGPPFDAHDYIAFLQKWNIKRRLSSAYYPQSNGRAEAGVKTAKRILLGNVNPATGKLDNDEAVKALLTHRNTPSQQTGVSPAKILFGRPIRDHLPIADLHLGEEWTRIADKREEAFARRHNIKRIPETKLKELPQLDVGDSVQIQNQTGTRSTKWGSTGFITDALPHRQYRVVVDGSRRVTLRNRRFLKKIPPFCRQTEDMTPDLPTTSPPVPTATMEDGGLRRLAPSNRPAPITIQDQQRVETTPHEEAPLQSLRRSTRVRRPPRSLSPKLTGQSHD